MLPFAERGNAKRGEIFGEKIMCSSLVEFGVTLGDPNGNIHWAFKSET